MRVSQHDVEENKGIPGQVPAIETGFMSSDEIARIFSKSQSPYIGGEIGIFPSPRAYIEGERPEFFQVPKIEENMKK